MAELFKTQKGAEACCYSGYSYRLATVSASANSKRWRCTKKRCIGKLWTSLDNENCREIGDHDHEPNPDICLVKQKISEMKDRAKTENTPVHLIHKETTIALAAHPIAAALFPHFRSVNSSLYNARHKNYPPMPLTIAEMEFPDDLVRTANGENFLLYASADKRILIFGTPQNLNRLCSSTHWFMDGTFAVVLTFYQQLFTVYGLFAEKLFPLVYCLLTEKTRDAYIQVFRKLKDMAMEKGLILSPTVITIDLENGLIPALQVEFPLIRIQGCYFHFCQAIFRQIQFSGLTSEYKNDENFRLHARCLMALAFLPESSVASAFAMLEAQAPSLVRPLFAYFRNQWLVTIDPSIWNVFGIDRRTNNDLEGWHSKFNRIARKVHGNVYAFAEKLLAEQDSVDAAFMQIQSSGAVVVARKNKKFEAINRRIMKFTSQYNEDRDVLTFLRSIAYELSQSVLF